MLYVYIMGTNPSTLGAVVSRAQWLNRGVGAAFFLRIILTRNGIQHVTMPTLLYYCTDCAVVGYTFFVAVAKLQAKKKKDHLLPQHG